MALSLQYEVRVEKYHCYAVPSLISGIGMHTARVELPSRRRAGYIGGCAENNRPLNTPRRALQFEDIAPRYTATHPHQHTKGRHRGQTKCNIPQVRQGYTLWYIILHLQQPKTTQCCSFRAVTPSYTTRKTHYLAF